ncbi:hypothetical protein BOTBODRAFT_47906 [Botryobasidium botryosum FD-172 SS1]|uniref:Uncharacterized protein n=1 Tax=Botryobasidium botryosum (strain FD-172 SS1) TaxID=930990 RepID=A0A067MBI5_BOTB1|nr:hypothetical protein BOTBODRAFT_47906 [Botryobasidium botryosum FD-172 SS1]
MPQKRSILCLVAHYPASMITLLREQQQQQQQQGYEMKMLIVRLNNISPLRTSAWTRRRGLGRRDTSRTRSHFVRRYPSRPGAYESGGVAVGSRPNAQGVSIVIAIANVRHTQQYCRRRAERVILKKIDSDVSLQLHRTIAGPRDRKYAQAIRATWAEAALMMWVNYPQMNDVRGSVRAKRVEWGKRGARTPLLHTYEYEGVTPVLISACRTPTGDKDLIGPRDDTPGDTPTKLGAFGLGRGSVRPYVDVGGADEFASCSCSVRFASSTGIKPKVLHSAVRSRLTMIRSAAWSLSSRLTGCIHRHRVTWYISSEMDHDETGKWPDLAHEIRKRRVQGTSGAVNTARSSRIGTVREKQKRSPLRTDED